MVMTPIDRIFTRIGADDSILERKSTFLKEMEDALNFLKKCTNKSLLVIDELGNISILL
jgi:DNA mismatch repair protein MSH6